MIKRFEQFSFYTQDDEMTLEVVDIKLYIDFINESFNYNLAS